MAETLAVGVIVLGTSLKQLGRRSQPLKLPAINSIRETNRQQVQQEPQTGEDL
jgi:hypothetical protein